MLGAMNQQRITKTWTFFGYFVTWAWAWLFAASFVAVSTESAWAVFGLLVMFAVYFANKLKINYDAICRRPDQIAAFAAANNLSFDNGSVQFLAKLGAVTALHNAREPRVQNVVTGDGWSYADFLYNIYHKMKGGEYHAATVYYGVLAVDLPRALPNVFFDSIKARHRQFRFHFARSQRHSLEGDFDKHFVTYFPPDYTIDSMSFISPDVMWALREAADYDIEIFEDRLFLYGPLYEPTQEIPDMYRKAMEIKKQLLDNITTYRDERLPLADGRKRVSGGGISLRLSTFWATFGTIATIIFFIVYCYAQFVSNN